MSRGGQKPGGGRRTITSDEAELWKLATSRLVRVKAKPRIATSGEPPSSLTPTSPSVSRTSAPLAPGKPTAALTQLSAKKIPREKKASPAPLTEFERRKARQIGSGKVEIGARIDLHGLRQHDAYARLRAFLLDAYAQGHKTVLVITGKGGDEPADRLGALAGDRQRGVLRRNVPSWLQEPDLRSIVLSYTQAGIRHGGAGALYVQLRKGR
jgi:DNA-nicking Smr family endonuclease